ncbi:MAG: hypothetical protein L0332_06275 [Chloroflexi bacterium]|nr:hypothetical protein [Chloroflexota bacterium]MCI0577032.1 hypothetical protein [Chloroflexota bacterium]MCI0648812.1 hypothetical protein [Chloroflexota bacterium]MCI0726314.1 hypothetical protein [Chloroflexota bacterium]
MNTVSLKHNLLEVTPMAALMGQLIDYAGLFPPAALSLPEAIENYARYRQGPDRWMLARFIIPAARLAELTAIWTGRFPPDDPFPFAILGRGGADEAGFLAGLAADLAAVTAFRQAHGRGVVVDVYEGRLPATAVESDDGAAPGRLLAGAGERLAAAGLRPFYEVALGSAWQQSMETTISAIAGYNRATGRAAGYKLRTGGVEAAAFPAPEQVAHAIAASRDAAVPMKATAGLHHPFRHFSQEVQTRMHGFVNVFAAGILAWARGLPEEAIAMMVADEEPQDFIFTGETLAWQGYTASIEEIRLARQVLMVSFGSCSFDEPREDLRAIYGAWS